MAGSMCHLLTNGTAGCKGKPNRLQRTLPMLCQAVACRVSSPPTTTTAAIASKSMQSWLLLSLLSPPGSSSSSSSSSSSLLLLPSVGLVQTLLVVSVCRVQVFLWLRLFGCWMSRQSMSRGMIRWGAALRTALPKNFRITTFFETRVRPLQKITVLERKGTQSRVPDSGCGRGCASCLGSLGKNTGGGGRETHAKGVGEKKKGNKNRTGRNARGASY